MNLPSLPLERGDLMWQVFEENKHDYNFNSLYSNQEIETVHRKSERSKTLLSFLYEMICRGRSPAIIPILNTSETLQILMWERSTYNDSFIL